MNARGSVVRGSGSHPRVKVCIVGKVDCLPTEWLSACEWLTLSQQPDPDLKTCVRSLRSDVLLVEIDRNDGSVSRHVFLLKRHRPELRILVLARNPDLRTCIRYLQAGVDGVYELPGTRDSFERTILSTLKGLKPLPPEIQASIISRFVMSPGLRNAISAPAARLSRAEHEIMVYLGMGLLNKEIAKTKEISERTVNTQTHSIYRKLNVHNRREAVLRYFGSGPALDSSDQPSS